MKRLSVAVALNQDALKGAKPADLKKFEQLVTAAVGADPNRGDTVAVVVRPFQATEIEAVPFWETAWFATILRNAVALIAVLLVLFLAVRPAVRALTRSKNDDEENADGETRMSSERQALVPAGAVVEMPNRERLAAQIELAQRIVREQPDDALQALRRMLGEARGSEGAAR